MISKGDIRLKSACMSLIASELRSRAYFLSPAEDSEAPGNGAGPETLQEHLVGKLLLEYAARYETEGLSDADLRAAIQLDRRARKKGTTFYGEVMNRAGELSTYQLWHDLNNDTGSRHQAAVKALTIHACEHLERAPAFRDVLKLYGPTHGKENQLIDEDGRLPITPIHQDFIMKRVWPAVLKNKKMQASPLHIHGFLRQHAIWFLSDEIRRLRALNVGLMPFKDASDDPLASYEESTDPDTGHLPTKAAGTWHSVVESEAVRSESEANYRHLLERMASTYQGPGPALLVLLLTAYPPPTIEGVGGGPDQQTAAYLNIWKNDPAALAAFVWGCFIDDRMAETVIAAITERFAAGPETYTTSRVRDLRNRYRARLLKGMRAD